MEGIKRALQKSTIRKPLSQIEYETAADHSKLERTLTLFDLLCIGVGGCVGSGIFVLNGLISHDFAGPGVIVSWILAGGGIILSAFSYAELSCLIPTAGSSYSYVYVGCGELLAFLTAFCLSLEYGISGAAVASAWGEKVQVLLTNYCSESNRSCVVNFSIGGYDFNIIGGVLQLLVMILMLRGVDVSKNVVNFFTIMKVVLICFIILAGMTIFHSSNFTPFLPFGVPGVFRGASYCFFGYLGYDEVCCLAAEAIEPQKNLPRAVIGTISIIAVIYSFAAVILIGMVPYQDIDTASGFSSAFGYNGWIWAQQLVAIGEITTLPLIVLVSFLAQPRLQYALAVDGLLPSFFASVDSRGNLVHGILFSGIMCIIITVVVPFLYLDDMASAGVLLTLSFGSTSLILIRYIQYYDKKHDSRDCIKCDVEIDYFGELLDILYDCKPVDSMQEEDTTSYDLKTEKHLFMDLILYHVFAIILVNLINYAVVFRDEYFMCRTFIGLCAVVLAVLCYTIQKIMKPVLLLTKSEITYQVPFMPYIPLFSIIVNYYMIFQLSWYGIITIASLLIVLLFFYFGYVSQLSKPSEEGWVHCNNISDSHHPDLELSPRNLIQDNEDDEIVLNPQHIPSDKSIYNLVSNVDR